MFRFSMICVFVCLCAGCATDFNRIPSYESSHTVGELKGKVKVGMPFSDALKLIGGTPAKMVTGKWHFILRDGDLWIVCERNLKGELNVVSWTFEEETADGGPRVFSSLDTVGADPLMDPEVLELELKLEYGGLKRFGRYRYEIYSPLNARVAFDLEGLARGEFILLGGRYYLLNAPGLPEKRVMTPLLDARLEKKQLIHFLYLARTRGTKGASGELILRMEDEKRPLSIPLSGGSVFNYPAPWALEGTFDTKSGKFEFTFGNWKFKGAGGRFHKQIFSGRIQHEVDGVVLPDNFSVAGWRVFKLRSGGGCSPVEDPPKVIGAFREGTTDETGETE